MHYPIMLWDRNKKYCRTFMFNRKVNNISLILNLNQACLVFETMPPLSDRDSQAEPRFHLLNQYPSAPRLLIRLFFRHATVLETNPLVFAILLAVFALSRHRKAIQRIVNALFNLTLAFTLFLLNRTASFFTHRHFGCSIGRFFIGDGFFTNRQFRKLIVGIGQQLFQITKIMITAPG